MESQNPVIMDIHNWIMDIHNWIMDIHNWIMDIHNCKPITDKAAIMDIHNQLRISLNCIMGGDNRWLKLEPPFSSWTRCKFPRDTFSRNTTCDVTSPIFTHNAIMDIHEWIMDIHNNDELRISMIELWISMIIGFLCFWPSIYMPVKLRAIRQLWTRFREILRQNPFVTIKYCDVIMGTMASQITSLTIVYSNVHSGPDQRKHQSSTSLAFVWGIPRWPVNSPCKWPVTRKMFPFDDVIMTKKCQPRTCRSGASPVDTWSNKNVVITSKRRHNVISTSYVCWV